MELGFISAKYESGNSGPGTISSGRGDPGGKSYGVHQFASKTGTVHAYIKYSKSFGSYFRGLRPGTKAFDSQWKRLAARYATDFERDQAAYAKLIYFNPIRAYANKLKIPNTRAINEALFSMAIQHGKAHTLVWRASVRKGESERSVINKLYKTRTEYVRGLSSLPLATKRAVLNRYVREERDVLALTRAPRTAPKEGPKEPRRKGRKTSIVPVFIIAIIVALAAIFGLK